MLKVHKYFTLASPFPFVQSFEWFAPIFELEERCGHLNLRGFPLRGQRSTPDVLFSWQYLESCATDCFGAPEEVPGENRSRGHIREEVPRGSAWGRWLFQAEYPGTLIGVGLSNLAKLVCQEIRPSDVEVRYLTLL